MRLLVCLLGSGLLVTSVNAQDNRQRMPRENVVDIPAVGEGLCVSNVFQSNMVLQRDKRIIVWGWADVGDNVTVSFGGHTGAATASKDRRWQVSLPALSASSEPRLLTVKTEQKTLVLENVVVGDVWILGGQSNMEFPLSRVENGQLEIVSANYPNIRILTIPAANGPERKPGFERLHEWSSWFRRHYRKGDWDVCTPDVAQELSAIGYVFARRIHMATQVPIGLIDASRGGTTVETWTPAPVLAQMKSAHVAALLAEWEAKVTAWDPEADLATRIRNYEQKVERFKKEGKELSTNDVEPTDLRPGPAMDQNRPGTCFASMIAPLEGLAVKGAIFHQGYNNCFNGTQGAIMYRQVFPEMIRAWRKTFNDPQMPFGILSLCTEGEAQTLENFSEQMANPGPFIREAQYQTFLELYRSGDKNIGFTSTYDLRRRWYHPQLKIPAGERIARWALATQYDFGSVIRWKPPMVEKVTVDDGRIIIQLDENANAVDDGRPIVGFAVAGEDRNFHPANAVHFETGRDDRGRPRTDKRRLVLSSPFVTTPIHFRYAWARSPLGNLQADRNSDVPFATQRSDQWALEAVPPGLVEGEAPGKLDRAQRREQQEALRRLDRERRIRELEALPRATARNP